MELPDDFYERIKERLYRRICRELQLAKRLLDIGCGSCKLDQLLADRNGTHVIGVDISNAKFPENKTRSGGIQCRKRNADNLTFLKDGSIDAVVSVYAFHEMNNALKVLKEAHRVLQRGGRLLIVDFPKASLAQRLWNENYYTRSQVASMLRQAGFIDVKSRAIFQGQLIWALAWKAHIEQKARQASHNNRKRKLK